MRTIELSEEYERWGHGKPSPESIAAWYEARERRRDKATYRFLGWMIFLNAVFYTLMILKGLQ